MRNGMMESISSRLLLEDDELEHLTSHEEQVLAESRAAGEIVFSRSARSAVDLQEPEAAALVEHDVEGSKGPLREADARGRGGRRGRRIPGGGQLRSEAGEKGLQTRLQRLLDAAQLRHVAQQAAEGAAAARPVGDLRVSVGNRRIG